jgi:chaperone BCS1
VCYRLDPALIRPGRVDFQALISHCTTKQIIDLFYNFYPESSTSQVDNFVNRLKELGFDMKLSPAVLQGHFLMHKNDPDGSIQHADNIKELLPRPKLMALNQ